MGFETSHITSDLHKFNDYETSLWDLKPVPGHLPVRHIPDYETSLWDLKLTAYLEHIRRSFYYETSLWDLKPDKEFKEVLSEAL